MDIITKLATSSITNTKLAVATLVALAAGGVALAAVPSSDYSFKQGVRSCKNTNNTTRIVNLQGYASVYIDGCVGSKQYNYSCPTTKKLLRQIGQCNNLSDLAFTQAPAGEGVEFASSTDGRRWVEVRLINNGRAKATSFPTIAIQWLDGDMITILKTESARGNLAPNPGELNLVGFMVGTSTPLNAKYLKASLDPQNVIRESDENNNLATREIPAGFLDMPTAPDLTIDNVVLNVYPAGYPIDVSVKNVGTSKYTPTADSYGMIKVKLFDASNNLIGEGNPFIADFALLKDEIVPPGQSGLIGGGSGFYYPSYENRKSVRKIEASIVYPNNNVPDANFGNNIFVMNVPELTTDACNDTDGGVFPALAGATEANGVFMIDNCLNTNVLKEVFCTSVNTPSSTEITRDNGYCKSYDTGQGYWTDIPVGATCADSDNSNSNYDQKGVVTINYGEQELRRMEDYCAESLPNTVIEFSCNSVTHNIARNSGDCPNGCQNGACIAPAPVVQPDVTFSSPGVSFSLSRYPRKVTIAYTNNSDSETTYLAHGVLVEWLDADKNQVTRETYPLDALAYKWHTKGFDAAVPIIPERIKYVRITLDAENQLNESDELNNSVEREVPAQIWVHCTDSDGGVNFNSSGTVTNYNATGNMETISDVCVLGTQLWEHSCDENGWSIANPTTTTCSGGCEDGACK
ncbi:MAG: hypothetical protein Q7S24_01390 [bacterium]|nr:hypothetical protein [bacterium]